MLNYIFCHNIIINKKSKKPKIENSVKNKQKLKKYYKTRY